MRKMKIFVSIVAILCLVFSLSACAGGESDEPEGQLDTIDVRDGDGDGDTAPEIKPDPGVNDDEGDPGGATKYINNSKLPAEYKDRYFQMIPGDYVSTED